MKKRKSLLLILSFLIGTTSAVALSNCNNDKVLLEEYNIEEVKVKRDANANEEYITVGGALFRAMQIKDGDYILRFRAYVPENAENLKDLPVMLFMHGAGERGENNTSPITAYNGMKTIFKEGSPTLNGIILVPQCPTEKKWVQVKAIDENKVAQNYSVDELEETTEIATVLKVLKYYMANYNVDTKRIYAMGMSMGGFATWDLITRHNDVFAAAIPICGGGDTSKVDVLKNTAIKTFHGSEDPLVDVNNTREMYNVLKEHGNIDYTEYTGAGHDIWNRVMEEEHLMDWLYNRVHA